MQEHHVLSGFNAVAINTLLQASIMCLSDDSRLFITCMSAHVCSKMTILRETFATNITLIWFIPSMNAHMYSKMTVILHNGKV